MTDEILFPEDAGSWAELSGKPNPYDLRIVFTPSLASTLFNARESKGKQLSRTEVGRILESVPAIAVTAEQAAALQADRGYEDVDPARAWEHWLEMDDDSP